MLLMAQSRGKALSSHELGPTILSVSDPICTEVVVEPSSQFQGPLHTYVPLKIPCHCNCTGVFQYGFCTLSI